MGTPVCLGAHLGVLEKPIPPLGLHSYGPSGEEHPVCCVGSGPLCKANSVGAEGPDCESLSNPESHILLFLGLPLMKPPTSH